MGRRTESRHIQALTLPATSIYAGSTKTYTFNFILCKCGSIYESKNQWICFSTNHSEHYPTDYSFELPSIKFFLTPYAVWLRLVIVILLIGCILLIKNTMFSLLALGNEKKELVQEWNFRSRELYYRNARVGPGLLTLDMI